MSFYPKLDRLDLDTLIRCFQGSPPSKQEAVLYYSEAAILIKKKGRKGIEFLLEQMGHADVARLRALICALTYPPQIDDHLIRDRLISYLQDKRPFIVMDAIDGLAIRREKGLLNHVLKLRTHPSPYVQGSVLRFIARLNPQKALGFLIKATKDTHYIVRETAADELGDLGKKQALPYLKSLLKDRYPHVRQAAQTAIEAIESMANNTTGRGKKSASSKTKRSTIRKSGKDKSSRSAGR